jgi:hypothetical protein
MSRGSLKTKFPLTPSTSEISLVDLISALIGLIVLLKRISDAGWNALHKASPVGYSIAVLMTYDAVAAIFEVNPAICRAAGRVWNRRRPVWKVAVAPCHSGRCQLQSVLLVPHLLWNIGLRTTVSIATLLAFLVGLR